MKKYLLLSAMLLAVMTGCAGGPKPQPAPSDEVLIAQEDGKIRAAVVHVVQDNPGLDLSASLALVSAAKGMPELENLVYSTQVVGCSTAAPCSAPPAAVAQQEGEEGHAEVGNSGTGTAQAAPAAGADSSVLSLDGPRPPADQRNPVQKGKLPGKLPE